MASDGALVTFLLNSIHGVGSIDLYGSWDNFSTAYPMQKDRQQAGHWFGCPDFKHVICHGDPSNCSMPQDRPLKMGATYWYFYRKNGSDEFFNKAEPNTTSCPLLPGQTVNMVELPILTSSAFLNTKTLTLQPDDRWSSPEPPRKVKSASLSAAGPANIAQSRAIWHSRSFGRLHTAIVEYALSGFESLNLSCDAQRRPSRRLQGRSIRSAPGPRAPSPRRDAKPLTPLPKLNVPKQTTPRRPALLWRPSDSYLNPFRPDTAATEESIEDDSSDVLDDEEYDLDGFVASADGSRPVTWSCSFPHLKKQTPPRPTSMPSLHLRTAIENAHHAPAEPYREPHTHHKPRTSKTSSFDEDPTTRPERLSIEPLRLPSALHEPLLDTEFAPALGLALAPPKPLDTAGALFPAATLPPSLGPGSISPSSTVASSYPDSLLNSPWPLPHATAGPPPTSRPHTPSPPASPQLPDDRPRAAFFSSQETIRAPPPAAAVPPVPPVPASPEAPPVKPRSSAGGRVRDMIASLEGRRSEAPATAGGVLARSKSGRRERIAALGRAIL